MNKKMGTIFTIALAVTAITANSLFAGKVFAKDTNNISGTAIETKYSDTTTKLSSEDMAKKEALKKGSKAVKNKYSVDVSNMDSTILLDQNTNTWNMSFMPNKESDDVVIKKMTIGPDDITNLPIGSEVYGIESKSGKGFDTYCVHINAKTGEVIDVNKQLMGVSEEYTGQ
jgi:uncharacterized membrane protein YkoI